mmetsp:Transcript_8060/g.20748  ORF Transcript_8060/g.20748 Transcript_8060/m.20748 type:complete len:236 (-) Transcript_8060:37-744(-)
MPPRSKLAFPAAIAIENSAFTTPEPFSTLALIAEYTLSRTAGANTMMVGWSIGASPTCPLASLTPVDVSVCGEPYPIATVKKIWHTSAAISMMCASGRYARYTSSGLTKCPSACFIPATAAMKFPWLMSTPLGSPVVPEVYMITAMSSAVTFAGSTGAASPSSRHSSIERTETPHLASFSMSLAEMSALMVTTYLSSGHCDAAAASTGSSFASATTAVAFVWLMPCTTPSSPRVA